MEDIFSAPIGDFSAPIISKQEVTGLIPSFLCTLEGWKSKIKNLHWSASNMNTHKLLDEIADFVNTFQDSLAEDYMGIDGKLPSTFLKGTPTNVGNTKELLKEMLQSTKSFYVRTSEDSIYCGITSETESFIHNINKYIYLIDLCE